MAIISVYFFYAWVVIIHACFIGISAFALWGKKLEKLAIWKVLILLAIPIVFLEFYWIPYAHYMELSLHTNQSTVLNFFKIQETTNIINQFDFFWYHPITFGAGTFLAYKIGRQTFLKNKYCSTLLNKI